MISRRVALFGYFLFGTILVIANVKSGWVFISRAGFPSDNHFDDLSLVIDWSICYERIGDDVYRVQAKDSCGGYLYGQSLLDVFNFLKIYKDQLTGISLFLIIASSCLSKCFHRILIKTPQVTAWAPIWARQKSSVFQPSTNMRTWDLERNDMHPSDANGTKPIRSISEPSSEQFRRIMESPDFRAVIDSANLMHREKAQEHFQTEAKQKQIASDAKPSNPYDSVLQQLKTSFRMETRSPRSPQNTS